MRDIADQLIAAMQPAPTPSGGFDPLTNAVNQFNALVLDIKTNRAIRTKTN